MILSAEFKQFSRDVLCKHFLLTTILKIFYGPVLCKPCLGLSCVGKR